MHRTATEPGMLGASRSVRAPLISFRSHVWLLAHPSMEAVARGIIERCRDGSFVSDENGDATGSTGTLAAFEKRMKSSDRRHVDLRNTIRWDRFEDGWPNLFIDKVDEMAGKDVIFLCSFHSPEVVFEQLSIIYAIPRYMARSFTLILPYFPTGTMERVDLEGQIATAKTLATLLSQIPLSARGPAQIMIFDIHALQERFYFADTVIPRLETAIPLLKRELQKLDSEKLTIAFPDDGAYKRFHSMFSEEIPTIICAKIRAGKKKIVKVKDGDPSGRHVVIVDDLVQTGGTLIECGKAILERGAACLSAYVTHPVFPQESWKKFVDSEPKFQNFWITDSLPHAVDIAKHPPFQLLSLCDVIANTLLGYDLLQQ